MNIKIEKLINKSSPYFETICEWQRKWWGSKHEEGTVEEFMSRCLYEDRIPQTYIAISDYKVVGMYQIDMYDNINVRPDYYPWLVNVYVDESERGKGICSILMKDSINRFKELGLKKIYLHTEHANLYEKYGWKLLEDVKTFEGNNKKIYFIDLK